MNEVAETIRQAILIEHEIDISAIALIRPGSLPKTSSGKIQRGAIRSAFLSESLDMIYQWRPTSSPSASGQTVRAGDALQTLEGLKDWLTTELCSRLNISSHKIDADRPIACYGLDSLAATEFVISIEESLGAQFPIDKLFLGAPSISRLAHSLYEQLHPEPPNAGESNLQNIDIEGKQSTPHQVISLSSPATNERCDENERGTRKTFTTRPSILRPCEPEPWAFDVAA